MGSDSDDRGHPAPKAPRLLTPIFGAPIGMKRKAAKALVRAHGPILTSPEVPASIAAPAFIRYRHGREEELMANVPNRLYQLVYDYWGYTLQPFHLQILELLFKGGFYDIMVPTEHGKSTLCNVVYPILSWMNNPNAAHILACTNVDDAKSWVRVIKMKIESVHTDPRSAALIRDYPWLAKPKGSLKPWGAQEITIDGRSDTGNRNPSMAAFGRGSEDIKGRRAKAIGDDLEGKGAIRETERKSLWEWITLEFMRTIEDVDLEPRRLFCNIGTPWDPDSVHFQLEDLTRADGTPIFTVYKQPYKYENGQLIWPAKRNKIAELRDLWKEDTRQWAVAMELNPKGDNPFALTLKEISEHAERAVPLEQETATFVSLDPASGSKNARTDYAGITVVRIQWPIGEILPMVDVAEAYKYTDESWPQVIFCQELASKHYGAPVMCEMNAMQKTYKTLFQRLAPNTKVIPFYTSDKNKFDHKMGVNVLKTLLRVNRLRICPGEGGEILKREIRDLGTGAHDHIAFSVWFPIFYVYLWQRRKLRRKAIVNNSPARNYQPAVAYRRVLKISQPFTERRAIPVDARGLPNERPMLPDPFPG